VLERAFKFRENGTTLARDSLAGATTFMVMSYIIFVNPAILSFADDPKLKDLGLPFSAALTSTCLVAGVMTLLMGLVANKAYAIAPGMGINVAIAYQLVAAGGLTMESAMGIIVMEGILITVLVLTGLRTAIFEAFPLQLKEAIVIGIGFFILFIGLVNGGLVVTSADQPVMLGDLTSVPVAMTALGLLVTIVLVARGWKTAIVIGVVVTTAVSTALNYAYGKEPFGDTTAVIPHTVFAAPDFSAVGHFDFGAFAKLGIIATILWVFSIMLSDFFDSMGTLIGVGSEAGYLDEKGDPRGLDRLLLVDSLAATAGGVMSASSATVYVESGAGVAIGGRTGWVNVVTALCFFAAMTLSPLVDVVPASATAPALVIVGYSMMRTLTREHVTVDRRAGTVRAVSAIDFTDLTFGLPATLTMTVMPLTYSITNGIGAGFLAYATVRLARGEWRQVHWLLYVVSLAFLVYFLFPLMQKHFGW
jgi:AGZA family xanthine/uracil permease-like MFS transporter